MNMPFGALGEAVAVPGREGGERRLLLVSPAFGGLLSIVKEDDDVPLFCGSEDCEISAVPVEGACADPASLSRSLSLLKGERGRPILVVRFIERFLSGVGESGWPNIPLRSLVWSGRGDNATEARSMLGACAHSKPALIAL